MKILVIGNGFLGTNIVQKLESEGHDILVFSKTLRESQKCQQIIGDIFDISYFTKALLWEPQVIIHTAWVTTHSLYTHDSSNYKYAKFTAELAQHVVTGEFSHLIILGSCAEYGPQSVPSIAGESLLHPGSLYAEQKITAFNSARESFLNSNSRLTWARIFQPYGPNQDNKRLLPYLIKSIKEGTQVQLSDTSTVHDWITTRDIASAIFWIINHDTPVEVDIGTGIGYTNFELLQFLEASLGISSKKRGVIPHYPSEKRVSVVGKTSPLFVSGWKPSDDLRTGLDWVLSS
jgi:nucleoside-diphosphate-sugar epimerase